MSCWRECSCKLKTVDMDKDILKRALDKMGMDIDDRKKVATSYGAFESNEANVDGAFIKDGENIQLGYVMDDGTGHFGIRGDFWGTGIDSESFLEDVSQQYMAEAFRTRFRSRRWVIQKDSVNADGEIEIVFKTAV